MKWLLFGISVLETANCRAEHCSHSPVHMKFIPKTSRSLACILALVISAGCSSTIHGVASDGSTDGSTDGQAIDGGPDGSTIQDAAPATAIPDIPSNVTATAGDGNVIVSWDASAQASSYSVYRSTSSTGAYTMLASCSTVSTTSCADQTVSNGTTYYYEVRAANNVGMSDFSAYASATPMATVDMTGVPASSFYQVVVTQAGITRSVFVYQSTAATTQGANHSNGWWDGELGKAFSYASFSGAGPFTVSVTKLGSTAISAEIRPQRLGLGTVTATVNATGSTVTFTLQPEDHVSVEFSDDTALMTNLVLMAQPAENAIDVPSTTDSNVYVATAASYDSFVVPDGKTVAYFPPGLHNIGYWQVPATVTHIYLADGAFVRGAIYSDRTGITTGIEVNGRGVLSGDQFAYDAGPRDYTLDISTPGYQSQSAGNLIEGIAIVDSPFYTFNFMGNGSTIKNLLVHGFQVQNDGLHIVGPNNTVENCFFHVNDDNIATVINHDDLHVTNNVFWALFAGSTFLMDYVTHTATGVQITHSDLIHASRVGGATNNIGAFINMLNAQYQSPSVISNYTISDLRVEDPVARLIDLRMIHASGTQDIVYQNWTFTDIHLDNQGTPNPNKPLLMFDAVDATYNLFGFVFNDFTVNGSKVLSNATISPGILSESGPVNTPTFQ